MPGIRSRTCALFLGCCLSVGASQADESVPDRARFDVTAGHLAQALSALDGEASPAGDLARARVLISAGAWDEANALLEQVMNSASTAYVRDHALAERARLLAASGQPAAALELLANPLQLILGSDQEPTAYRAAALNMQLGRFDRAGAVLQKMKPGYWVALGYLNLASYVHSEEVRNRSRSSRPLVSLRVALALLEESWNASDASPELKKDLKSRILLRAGYLALEQEDYIKARDLLDQLPVDGLQAPMGFYLHGVATAKAGDYRRAMQSWHRAKKYPLAFEGVDQAWLAMASGYEESGYIGQAGEAYLEASSVLRNELVTLSELIGKVKTDGAWQEFANAGAGGSVEWFLRDGGAKGSAAAAYFVNFLPVPEYQRSVEKVSTLNSLRERIALDLRDLNILSGHLKRRSNQAGSAKDRSEPPGLPDSLLSELETRVADLRARTQSTSRDSATVESLALQIAELRKASDALPEQKAEMTSKRREAIGRLDQLREELKAQDALARELLKEAEARMNTDFQNYLTSEQARFRQVVDLAEQELAHLYEYIAESQAGSGAQKP